MTRRVPIRWKLTLWYAALFTLAMLMLGAGLYLGLRLRLDETLDEQVMVQERLVRDHLRVDGGRLALDGSQPLLDDGALVQVIAADRTVVSRWGIKMEAQMGATGIDAALDGRTTVTTVRAADADLRVRTSPIRQDGAIVGAVQVALPADDVRDTLSLVLTLLAIAAPAVLTVSGVGGYILAGRALSPVAAITTLAAGIGERHLAARIDLDLPDDELGRLAGTFNAMLERIDDAFQRQRRFSGDVAHELRTPLGLMRGHVDLALARPRSPEDYREALLGLDQDLDRLTRLIGSLLTLARADAGKLAFEPAPFDLADTVERVLEHYEPAMAEAGISVERQTTPTPIVADESLLVQVLVNLFDNALAHTPDHGRIAIGCRLDGARSRLWISDTGPGIPLEHGDRVFDRFYRIDTGRSRALGGTGLGLAIVRAIVEAHGGEISVTTGDGARFDVVLPVSQPDDIHPIRAVGGSS